MTRHKTNSDLAVRIELGAAVLLTLTVVLLHVVFCAHAKSRRESVSRTNPGRQNLRHRQYGN